MGAGRKSGPQEDVRRNRVAAMFTDAELAQLNALAKERGIPVGTVLYQLAKRALSRKR